MSKPAILVLADGTVFRGRAPGADGVTVGEVVFNTAITGYQEILTDPSYDQQLVTLTYPHIGNVGVNALDAESHRVFAAGLIVRDCALHSSNFRQEQTLGDYLMANDVVAIGDIDTRKLTRLLRDGGAQNGCIAAGAECDVDAALARARAFPGLKGADLAQRVTTRAAYPWTEGVWALETNAHRTPAPGGERYKVVAFDFGIKRNILRLLAEHGCDLTVVPAKTPASEVFAMNPDGVFLSNGPGDPEPCDYAIAMIREVLARKIPIFGICLGHQLLGLACGAKTVKMKFGHHGANHPVQELATGRVLITSQNHGFAVDEATLPPELLPTHRSLFDGTLQGLRHAELPAFSFQGHPEASPGPHDVGGLFNQFVSLMRQHRASRQ
ncbi:MAG: glutamine-hydrolyzing carbamoyl-phosphate synthase small subunit [Gammaproteobacteria bacterium]|nr:glutamine-hydrolyzing carbamoyl-phosphate synthase small subunit [Gammaproteobacteria bacterium]MBI5614863.1 glutamine-hydrolyzing carbamoyl-phosphate synthase small subunit [Gammaproteobacteria bacterium]